jgi:hypothetical protein
MADREQAEAMIKQTQATLIESQQFSYQHLVNAATEKFFNSSSHAFAYGKWDALVSYLIQCSSICSDGLLNLHDAAVHTITESLRSDGHQQLPVSLCVRNQIERYGYTDWYSEIKDVSQQERVSRQSPWVWRPLR